MWSCWSLHESSKLYIYFLSIWSLSPGGYRWGSSCLVGVDSNKWQFTDYEVYIKCGRVFGSLFTATITINKFAPYDGLTRLWRNSRSNSSEQYWCELTVSIMVWILRIIQLRMRLTQAQYFILSAQCNMSQQITPPLRESPLNSFLLGPLFTFVVVESWIRDLFLCSQRSGHCSFLDLTSSGDRVCFLRLVTFKHIRRSATRSCGAKRLRKTRRTWRLENAWCEFAIAKKVGSTSPRATPTRRCALKNDNGVSWRLGVSDMFTSQ